MYSAKGVSNGETLHIKKRNIWPLSRGVIFTSGEQRTTELDLITRALKRRAQNQKNYPGWELSRKYNRRRWSGEGRVYIVSSPARHPAGQGSFQTNPGHVQWNTVACKKTSCEINQSFVVLPSLHSVLFKFPVQVTSDISISTLEIRQERTSRFYLWVEWTSTFGILTFTDKHIR